MWGAGNYELVAQRFGEIHDELVARLVPRAGERWLDLATGTGEVALRAARAGASAVGVDVAGALLDQARAKAERDGLQVEWQLGDAQALEQPDAAFDVVSSCFGVIFAPDHGAVAAELARVCRPNGRLGLTTWRPNEGLHAIYEQFSPSGSLPDRDEWGTEEHVHELLDEAFELEIGERTWHLTGESPEAVWDLMSEGAPPAKALIESLEPDRRAEFHEAMLERWGRFRTADGVDEPRRYLLVVGRRR
jgi:ubiquinone/menaquinone biosynthesis C-methylase UbiE